ncbi:flavin reductase [Oscillospiraceae bacterium MB08-C2-2]|nr:flavin reductase [Oscillospiraceae bacterium MB08-C2-2]
MDVSAMFKINCGLFLAGVTTDKPTGCIINTVMQVGHSPLKCSLTMSQDHYTHSQILQAGSLAITTFSKQVRPDIIKRFGFTSGKVTDKFQDIAYELDSQGNPYLLGEYVSAVFALTLSSKMDIDGGYTIFLCDVKDAVKSEGDSITYGEYLENVKKKIF